MCVCECVCLGQQAGGEETEYIECPIISAILYFVRLSPWTKMTLDFSHLLFSELHFVSFLLVNENA